MALATRLSFGWLLLLPVLAACSFEGVDAQNYRFGWDGGREEERSGDDAGTEAAGDGIGDATPESTAPEATGEVGPGDAPAEVEVEHCQGDPDCEDGIKCTQDWCLDFVCVHEPIDGKCQGGDLCRSFVCDPELDCQATPRNLGEDCLAMIEDKCVTIAHCDAEGHCTPVEGGRVECPELPCQKDGKCDEVSGQCAYEPVETGTDCDDGNGCTSDDSCQEGACQGTLVPADCLCDTDVDCEKNDDGNLCNGKVLCLDGFCDVAADTIVDCGPEDPAACSIASCEPTTGQCVESPKGPGEPCDDHNACTVEETCDGAGWCAGDPLPEGDCDLDADGCTLDYCDAGECLAGGKVECNPPPVPCYDSTCNPQTGQCQTGPLPDGAPCDDKNNCTKDDACQSTICIGGINTCADCTLAKDAGHPCDDNNPETVGDFCFEHKCVGFQANDWKDATSDGTGINRVSSIDQQFHSLGQKLKKGTQTILPYVLRFATDGLLVGTDYYPNGPLVQMDGRVAVGPPDRVYFYGAVWTENNNLKLALKTQCPLDGLVQPVAAAHRFYGSASSPGDTKVFSEMAVIGFKNTGEAGSGQCLLAICGKPTGGVAWTCSKMTFKDLMGLGASFASKPEVTAIWMPVSGLACSSTDLTCFPDQTPLYVGLRADTDKGYRIGIVRTHAAFVGNAWETLYTSDDVTEPLVPPMQVTDIRVDSKLNSFSVGTHDFIYVKPASSAGYPIPHLKALGTSTVHYYGIYRSDLTTVLLADLIESTGGGDGSESWQVQAGVVAGSETLLFDAAGKSNAFLIPLASFSVCSGCLSSPLGTWGLTDLALLADHPEQGKAPAPNAAPLLAVVGTLPAAETETPYGYYALLSAE
jgi:hypothetical protein